MAYTQGQLEALERALASGVRQVMYQGRTVTYASTEELRTAIATVKNAMASQNGTRIRQYRFGSGKGL